MKDAKGAGSGATRVSAVHELPLEFLQPWPANPRRIDPERPCDLGWELAADAPMPWARPIWVKHKLVLGFAEYQFQEADNLHGWKTGASAQGRTRGRRSPWYCGSQQWSVFFADPPARQCFAIEIDPGRCDVIRARQEVLNGND